MSAVSASVAKNDGGYASNVWPVITVFLLVIPRYPFKMNCFERYIDSSAV